MRRINYPYPEYYPLGALYSAWQEQVFAPVRGCWAALSASVFVRVFAPPISGGGNPSLLPVESFVALLVRG